MRLFKNHINKLLNPLAMMCCVLLITTACSDDDDAPVGPQPTGDTEMFVLNSVSDPGISGMVTFTENDDNSTTVTIDLNGTSNGDMHPSHIHFNTAAEGGDIAVSLNSVNGNTGMSETVVTMLDNGTSISYDELVSFDGYINVHLSASDLSTLVAQGDIGENALTGEMRTYTLEERDVEGISGMVTFAERANGYTLATIELMNTPADGMHPAHIHMNSALEGGDIAVTFTPVDGASGMSMTNIEMTDGGNALTYNDIIMYDGYVNVHLSASDLGTIVAQGDIGSNTLTGETIAYALGERDVAGVSGMVTFAERMDGTILATIMLDGTSNGTHPAHIHMNSAEEGGGIVVTFTPVDGASGVSMTNISMTDGGDAFVYSDVSGYDGYVNVHLSAEDLATLVAQGNIGSNANPIN
ncbi:CHRD domain-containing protein [Roseivirga sp. BDSF3-8]|uniref:CHRD domain-containing protein n=1 Tax=Roseivirga sp. BDSF3-8 TaxID=3241598 RepID=UPI003532431A